MREELKVVLYIAKGMRDYLGKIWEENRYRILDKDGMDWAGEHMSLDECSETIQIHNELWSEVGTYSDYATAKIERDRGNVFFEETQQNLVNVIEKFDGSKICTVKTFRI